MEPRPDSVEQKDNVSRQRIERYKQNRLREIYQIVEGQDIRAKTEKVVLRGVQNTSYGKSRITKPVDHYESHIRSKSCENPQSHCSESTGMAHTQYQTRDKQLMEADRQEQRPRIEMKGDKFIQRAQQAQEQENRFRESRLNDPANTFHQEYNSRNELEEEIIAREYATRQSRFEAECLDIARRRQERERRTQVDQNYSTRGNHDEFETRQERWEAECHEIAQKRQERIDKEERERRARADVDDGEYRWVARDRQEKISNREPGRHAESTGRGSQRWEATKLRERSEIREPTPQSKSS